MIKDNVIKSEKGLRDLIARNLRKEINPGTKPSIDFIHHILEEAYESGMPYDVSDLQNKLLPTLDFMLHDWLKVDELTSRPRFEEHSRETFDELLQAASEVAANRFEPAYRISDEQEPYDEDSDSE